MCALQYSLIVRCILSLLSMQAELLLFTCRLKLPQSHRAKVIQVFLPFSLSLPFSVTRTHSLTYISVNSCITSDYKHTALKIKAAIPGGTKAAEGWGSECIVRVQAITQAHPLCAGKPCAQCSLTLLAAPHRSLP